MKNKIIELRKNGLTYNEIVKIVGCAKSTISYHCKNIKIEEIKNEKNKELNLKQTDIDIIIEQRKKGVSYEIISKELKISYERISRFCKLNNLTIYRKYNTINEELIEIIRKKYVELKSTRKVAKECCVSRDSVGKYVKDLMILKPISDRKKKMVTYVVNWRQRTKQKLVNYKGGKCEKCSYNKCLWSLEFHHKDPEQKDFTITAKSWAFERLKKEVDKCTLLCSNCHGEEHYKLNLEKI